MLLHYHLQAQRVPQAFPLKMDPTEQKNATPTGSPNSSYSN